METFRSARERLRFFVDNDLLPEVPSTWQIVAGSVASLPVVLGETAGGRANSRRTLLGQIPLRVPLQTLFAPGQAFSVHGLLCSESTVRRHILSVFHEDEMVVYDLQLLQTFPGGLDRLEAEARETATSRSLRARLLRNVVGGAGYHARVAALCEPARSLHYPACSIDPRFGSLVGFMRYCLTMPDWPDPSFYGFDWQSAAHANDPRPSWRRGAHPPLPVEWSGIANTRTETLREPVNDNAHAVPTNQSTLEVAAPEEAVTG
jgi:hypothetical protein